MTQLEVTIPALCAWRECRGGGTNGMQSVINVLQNRAKANKTSLYIEATKYEQFTSIAPPIGMTALESEADCYPQSEYDWALYKVAEDQVLQALAGTLPDITGGATMYYAGDTTPHWDFTKLTYTQTIAGQKFYRLNG